ncbi:MAG: peptidoglycan-binding protein, partial [Deltaproteobacteria bacterium]|nr:peptidoglycan-binding protein [Nannocystaceae bacterium]
MEELERIYELYLEYQHQVEDLEAGGHDGTPLFADYVAERDRAWEAYLAQGGHEPPLHSASGGASTPNSSATSSSSASTSPSSGGGLGGPRDRPVIRHGSQGAAVADAQRRLGISDDGSFGDETRRHTRQFQRAVGLDDDGVIGPLTWAALLEPFSIDPRRPTTPTSPPPAEHDVCAEEDNTVTLTHGAIAFVAASAWCSDTVQIIGFADTGPTSTPIEVEVRSDNPAKSYAKIPTTATGGLISCSWRVLEVLPAKNGTTVRATLDVHA